MSNYNLVLSTNSPNAYQNVLSIVKEIRNCIMHNSSITILIRYKYIKTKQLRRNNSSKLLVQKFVKTKKELLGIKKESYNV